MNLLKPSTWTLKDFAGICYWAVFVTLLDYAGYPSGIGWYALGFIIGLPPYLLLFPIGSKGKPSKAA